MFLLDLVRGGELWSIYTLYQLLIQQPGQSFI
jgi:hypothetical protein